MTENIVLYTAPTIDYSTLKGIKNLFEYIATLIGDMSEKNKDELFFESINSINIATINDMFSFDSQELHHLLFSCLAELSKPEFNFITVKNSNITIKDFYSILERMREIENTKNKKLTENLALQEKRQTEKPEIAVFRGGGAKGVAYIGAIRALEETKLLEGITSVRGSSIGAITALLVSLGCDSQFIEDNMSTISFRNLKSEIKISNFINKGGFYDTDTLKEKIKNLIDFRFSEIKEMKDLLEKDSQFIQELSANNFTFENLTTLKAIFDSSFPGKNIIKDLVITGTEKDPKTKAVKTVFFSNTPDQNSANLTNLTLFQAASISASLPGVFTHAEIDGKLYSDGGVLNNTPTPENLTKEEKNKVLVFTLEDEKNKVYSGYLHKNRPAKMNIGRSLFDLSTNGEHSKAFKNERTKLVDDYHHNVITLDSKTVKTTTSHIENSLKKDIIAEAKTTTLTYLYNYGHLDENTAVPTEKRSAPSLSGDAGKSDCEDGSSKTPSSLAAEGIDSSAGAADENNKSSLFCIQDDALSSSQLAAKKNLTQLKETINSSILLIEIEIEIKKGTENKPNPTQEKQGEILTTLNNQLSEQKCLLESLLKNNDVRSYNKEECDFYKNKAENIIVSTMKAPELKQNAALRNIINFVTRPLSAFLGLLILDESLLKQGFFKPTTTQQILKKASQAIQQGETHDVLSAEEKRTSSSFFSRTETDHSLNMIAIETGSQNPAFPGFLLK